MDTTTAISKLKKLSFSKSWQNTYISKTKNIVNYETGKPQPTELDVFVFIPALSIIQSLSNDKEFLAFRMENKTSSDYNYNLIADKTENNNRRLAIMYVAQFLNAAGIAFLLDDSYALYIAGDELQKLGTAEEPAKKDLYNSFYMPKTHAVRKGAEETWSN